MTSPCAAPKLDDASFEKVVTQTLLPVLVLFASHDCHGCEIVELSLAQILAQCHDRMLCFCVDAAASPGVMARFHITQLPTILIMRGGRVARRLVGNPRPGELEAILQIEGLPSTEGKCCATPPATLDATHTLEPEDHNFSNTC